MLYYDARVALELSSRVESSAGVVLESEHCNRQVSGDIPATSSQGSRYPYFEIACSTFGMQQGFKPFLTAPNLGDLGQTVPVLRVAALHFEYRY